MAVKVEPGRSRAMVEWKRVQFEVNWNQVEWKRVQFESIGIK